MHRSRHLTREIEDGVSVKAQLEDMARFALGPRQLRVDWLVQRKTLLVIIRSNEKVGNPSNALVHEGHLVNDVVATIHRVANSSHPLLERLVRVTPRYLIDRASLILQICQAVTFVG